MGGSSNKKMEDSARGRSNMSQGPLDPATTALVRLAAAVAEGDVSELQERLAAAQGAGVPPLWIDELLLQSILAVGYPLTLSAFVVWPAGVGAMGGCEEAGTVNAEVGTRNAEQQVKSVVVRDLKERTKTFALSILRLVDDLARSRPSDVIGRQLLRAATSVAANYRSARRARSRKEFLAKMGIVEEEADESAFWLELMLEAGLVNSTRIAEQRDEAGQLVGITIASIRTAREGGRSVPRSAFRVPR